MATVEEVRQRISVANARIATLNNERQVNMGKRETLEKQLQAALDNYEKTYGVKLSIDNLDAELQNVLASKEKEVASIEAVLSAIAAGNYDEANRLVNAEKGGNVVDQSTTSAVDMAQPVSVSASAPVTEATNVGVSPASSSAPVLNSTTETVGTTSSPAPSMPTPSPAPATPQSVVNPEPVSSQSVGTSQPSSMPTAPSAPPQGMMPMGGIGGGTMPSTPMGAAIPDMPLGGTSGGIGNNSLSDALQGFTSPSGQPVNFQGLGTGEPMVKTQTPTDFKSILNGSDFATQ